MRTALAAAVTMSVAPTLADAQFAPLAPVNPGDRVTDLDVIANATYESNVAQSDAALAAARHIKPSDVIFSPQIRAELSRPIGRQTLYLLGSVGYTFYARNSILNRESIQVSPGVLGQISVCQYDVSGSYIRAQSELSELAFTPEHIPLGQNVKNTLQVGQVSGGANCGRAVGLAPTVRVTESWARNSSAAEQGVNVNSFSTQDGISYRRPSFGSLTLFAAYAKTSYPERTIIDIIFGLPPANAGYQTYSGGISYTRPVGARLVGSASISYTSLQNAVPGANGFSGFTYSAALNYAVTPRLNASLNIARATEPSNRLNSTFKLDELYSGEANYQLTRRGSLKLGVSYENENYGGYTILSQFDLTKEKIYSGYINAEYRLNRRLSIGLGLNQSHRSANFPGLTFDDTRATLGFKSTF